MATIVGDSGDNVIIAGGGADSTLNGMIGSDYLEGGSGNDLFDFDYGTLSGSASGVDIMRGRNGDDVYHVDDVSDQVIEDSAAGGSDTVISDVSYTLSTNVENLTLLGTAGNGTGNTLVNIIIGNTGDNIIDGGTNADTMDGGGGGNDTFYVDSLGDNVINTSAAPGTEVVTVISRVDYFLDGSSGHANQLNANIQVVSLAGTAAVDVIGNGQANTLVGNSATNILDGGFANGILPGDEVDTLNGGAGADTMIGRDGNDVYFVDNAGDTVTELAFDGSDTINSTITVNLNNAVRYGTSVENLVLIGTANINGTALSTGPGNAITGNSGRNTLTGGDGDDILSGGQNTGLLVDRMLGGDGDDTFIVYNTGDVIIEAAGEGTDEVIVFTSFSLSAAAMVGQEIENLTLIGTATSGTGNALNNIISGNALDNTLDGRAGDDTMVGGDGNDLFFVDTVADFVDEILNQGTDTVSSTIDYALTTFVENLILTGTADIDGTGNDYDNTITGNSGDNTLDGGIGADTMAGGLGDDTYIVDQVDDVVTETSTATSTDTVRSDVTYTLGANLENLVLTGTNAIDGTGNAGGNVITGNAQANTLDGAGGGDTLDGGDGDDYYIIDGGDTVIDSSGIDTVESSATFVLSAGLENLVLTGTANINGTGNASDNTITGNDGSNTLDGQGGADTMAGGAGNDTYVVDDALDVVIESAFEGTDTVLSSVTTTLGANLENLTLTGSLAIDGTGNAENNTIIGNTAANVLAGGLGDDVYFVDQTDTLTENAGEGTDSVFFTTSVAGSTFVLGADVENLTLQGSNAINGTGNAGDNVITGNSVVNTLVGNGGADTLDGGTGADTMDGGLGDDSYVVDNVGDVVIDAGGIDTLQTSANFNLLTNGMGIENLTLLGTATLGTGDNSANVITGNASANTLTGLGGDDTIIGGAGNDTMVGGLGNDLFVVDSSTDVVTELTGQGTDTVQSSATFSLTTATATNNFVENLVLTGTGSINGTGNTLVNTITGNIGNNTLDGGTGADTLIGGDGDDTYVVDAAGDVVTELAAEGNDTIRSSASYTLALLPDIENLTLTGTANIDGTGNAVNNTLVGNAGVNTLAGGLGDDTYIINSNDVVLEGSGEGNDTLIVTITSGSFVVPANFENVIIIGTGNFNITGGAGSNTLGGNAGNNTLDGGAGADVMSGGKGLDVYIVDDVGDVVTENAGEGTDTVRASVDYTLSANVENLILTGTANIDGTGNGGDNIITGNSGNNTLDGGLGTDRLVGGLGDDTYIIDNNRDVISDTGGHDTVYAPYSYTLAASLEDLVLTGTSDLNGTGNASANAINGNSGDNLLTGLAGNDALVGGAGDDSLVGGLGMDTMTGGADNDFYSIDNAGDVVVELAGEGTDTASISVSYVFDPGSEIETISMSGTLALSVTATDSDNLITGTVSANRISALDGDDVIFGLGGADSIDAGLGNDTIYGGAGQDTMRGGDGADTFVIESSGTVVADIIQDFDTSTDADVLDISDLLAAYDPLTDVLTDFVRILDSGANSLVQVDANGALTPGGFVTVAILQGITGLTGEAALVASGNLIVS